MDKLQTILLVAPVFLFSMVAHEYAHGYAALKQGDSTAYQLGRLTWNPLKHLDPVFSIVLPLLTMLASGFVLGGAKPIPVQPRNYRNYKRGDIIVSLAGVATNFVLAILATMLAVLFGFLGETIAPMQESFAILQAMMRAGVAVNLGLMMFNLLPLPPLDGSHVMKYLLPPAWALRYAQFGMYGIFVLLLMMGTGIGRGVIDTWMAPAWFLVRTSDAIVAPFAIASRFLGA